MLVLSRKINETIRISDNISITVVSVEGGAVKLGIIAPQDISIHRGEVYDRIQQENRQAASSMPENLTDISQYWNSQRNRGTGEHAAE